MSAKSKIETLLNWGNAAKEKKWNLHTSQISGNSLCTLGLLYNQGLRCQGFKLKLKQITQLY